MHTTWARSSLIKSHTDGRGVPVNPNMSNVFGCTGHSNSGWWSKHEAKIHLQRTEDRWWCKLLYYNDMLNSFLCHVNWMNDRCYCHMNIIAVVALTNWFIPKWMLIPSSITGELFTGEYYCVWAKSYMKAFEAPEGLQVCGVEGGEWGELTRPL